MEKIMAKLNGKEISSLAVKIVKETPGGIRYGALVKLIQGISPETPVNHIHGRVFDIQRRFPKDVSKPSRGLFVPVDGDGKVTEDDAQIQVAGGPKIRESDFYAPFAEYLRNDLGEVTVATPLGGAGLGKKWGTPDVVGVYKPSFGTMIKFNPEVVSAEIKVDPQQTIVAFGQAIAYRLFSSKTYIVMPRTIGTDELERLDALCMLFGVGLVRFDADPKDPKWEIRVRAQRFFPDMFYLNEFAERLQKNDHKVFKELFG
jgi:hypothetical protein